jgi:23S rRNA (adenine2030-N6)-methyltransferase
VNYRHAYHAGNFADVVKHLALVAVVEHLKKKTKPFVVVDTHGGRGLYDLRGDEAKRTGEAEAGIARLSALHTEQATLRKYLSLVGQDGFAHYPGSPLIAARLLRAQDRLVAIEKHEEEANALVHVLAPFSRARADRGDGYTRLMAMMPPPERRGLILIDPPYEATDEFEQAARAFAQAFRRFATGVYMLWFPIKSKRASDAFCAEVLSTGVDKALRVDIDVGGDDDGRLGAAGLLVVNPSYGLGSEMSAALAVLAPLLGHGGRPASYDIIDLLGD